MIILGTGLSGLVGSRVTELLAGAFSFQNLSLETGVNITDKNAVDTYFSTSKAPWVWHFAAITNVDLAEKERSLGEKSNAWKVNVLATEYIVDACMRYNKHLLYLSTDFVFDGNSAQYSENDVPIPQGWYAITKYEGEKRIDKLGHKGLIVRIANPYGGSPSSKPDFVETIRQRLANGLSVSAPSDQVFVPTFIDDIAFALGKLVTSDSHGIYHAVGSQALSPFVACQKIAASMGVQTELVQPVLFKEYFKNRAPRPFHAHLTNDKISNLGIHMKSFDEGLVQLNKSIS